jgi:ribosomal protein S18 acetylase RimI-like enzyme
MYRQEYYAFQGNVPVKAMIRNYTKLDFEALVAVQKECFPPPFPEELWWNEEQLKNHVELFPEGAFCVGVDGEVVGSMTALIVNYKPGDTHSWEEVTDNGYIRNHNPKGNTLYVVDISVKPAFRKLGIGKKMMQAMYETVVHLDLDRLLGGGRLPGYHKHSAELSPEQYVEKVVEGELKDPVTTFLMRVGRVPVGVAHNYLDDDESGNCAALMEWKNPFKNS